MSIQEWILENLTKPDGSLKSIRNSKTRTIEQLFANNGWSNQYDAIMKYTDYCYDPNITFGIRLRLVLAEQKTHPICKCCPKHTCIRAGAYNTFCSTQCRGKWYTGENNGFFGREHTKETKDKIREKSLAQVKHPAFLAQVGRGFDGEHFDPSLQGQIAFYGEEEGPRKYAIWKKKISGRVGELNPQFGKPAPVGSGCGWGGWYTGEYFRSLGELSWLYHARKAGIEYVSGESKKYMVPYVYQGSNRNYFPDYVCGNTVIEIKPSALQDTEQNILKREAAAIHFPSMGMEYKVVSVEYITEDIINELVLSGDVVWNKSSQRRWEKRRGA